MTAQATSVKAVMHANGDHGAANPRVLRDGGGGHAHLLGADEARDVLAVQQGVLAVGLMGHAHVDTAAQGGDGVLVRGADAGAQGGQADGAVHGAGVQVEDAETGGDGVGDGGFARADGAIECDVDRHRLSLLLFGFELFHLQA